MDQPTRIGSYEIAEVLGEGAMGTVYTAHQREPVQRTVALKVLKATDEPADLLDRYETERQALAVMDHPSIARVFDAGVTDDGDPYVVMERVAGSSILRFSDEHRLTIAERLALFAKVCHAVQHAHLKGVIHRDLKPEHVLVSEVDGLPLPKIIDFGIATAVDPEVFIRSRSESRDSIIGTPAYMSPEQINGLSDIDTRSDVYSLGIILYELLVGAAPFDVPTKQGWGAVAAQIMSDPPTPTARFGSIDTQDTVANLRRTTPDKLKKVLHDDIDWIVRRAMAKDRAERYETAHEFAREIERHLAGRPVHAHPPGVAYSTRKFVRRNKLAVGSTGVIAAGLVAFAVTTSVQAARLDRARAEAEIRRSQAEGLIGFVLTDLWSQLDSLGRLDILVNVGDRAAAYFVAVPPEGFTDEELSSLSQAMYQMGDVRMDQGRLPEASAAFEASLRLARALYDRDPTDNGRLYELGQAEYWAAYRYFREQRYQEALPGFTAYRDISDELLRRDPDDLDYQLEVAMSHSNVGVILHRTGVFEDALAEFQKSLEAKLRVAAIDPGPGRDRTIGQSHEYLGRLLTDMGRLDEAEEHFATDVALKEALVAQSPENAQLIYRLVIALGDVADIRHARGDISGALEGHQVRRDYLVPLVQDDPSNLRWLRNLGVVEAKQAHVLADGGELIAALGLLGPAIERLERAVDQNPDQPGWRANLATAHAVHTAVLLRQGQTDEAGRASQSCLTVATTGSMSGDPEKLTLARCEVVRAQALGAADRPNDAAAMYESAIDRLSERARDSTDEDVLMVLATALVHLGRLDEARTTTGTLVEMGYATPELLELREKLGVR